MSECGQHFRFNLEVEIENQAKEIRMAMRRGRLDKDFPVIKPSNSQWGILDVLAGLDEHVIRNLAVSSQNPHETDILLAAPLPSPTSPQKNQALGLFYVGESARKYGFRVEYWDARHDAQKEFLEKASRANFVGFTAITGYQLLEMVKLATLVKERWPEKVVILGGAHATLTKPQVNLSDPLIDYVVMGEGELRLPALMAAHYREEGMELVDGIGYKNSQGEMVVQPSLHVPDLSLHLPRAVNQYTLKYFVAAAERNEMILPTTRGCPWSTDSCDFCSVGKQYMDSYRKVPFEIWRDDIEEVRKHAPVRHIEPEDENSAIAIKPNEPYLSYLSSIGATSHLHLRSDQLKDPEKVLRLAEMGVKRIHIGVESGNERVLNQVMHKNERVEDHYLAAKNMAAAGIEMVATYIVANPTETWGEINDTLDLAENLMKTFSNGKYRATVYVLAALPGTPIYYTIERMHDFVALLDRVEESLATTGKITKEMAQELFSWSRRSGPDKAGLPKAADTVQPFLDDFLSGKISISKLREESLKWLWPTPKTMREWTKASAAYNPFLPEEWNAIYPIAGMHFNKNHKTAQNFPGWKRLLIRPFERMFDLRFKYRYFKHSGFELWAVGKLINWASKRAVGENLGKEHRRKVMENYSETLAGH